MIAFSFPHLLCFMKIFLTSFQGIFVVGAKRTAFGAFGGKLKDKTATDLAEHACRAALQAASIAPEHVNHIIIGERREHGQNLIQCR